MKLMHPFLIGGALTFYGFAKIQNMMCESETFANDPQNPKYAEIQARKHRAEAH
ncbi:hypothetical protein GGF46_002095 [Coemansia sp. RSA 552]|nr:hypothetical protein GGF46_002095 [Coemansia sp. RSA 552]